MSPAERSRRSSKRRKRHGLAQPALSLSVTGFPIRALVSNCVCASRI